MRHPTRYATDYLRDISPVMLQSFRDMSQDMRHLTRYETSHKLCYRLPERHLTSYVTSHKICLTRYATERVCYRACLSTVSVFLSCCWMFMSLPLSLSCLLHDLWDVCLFACLCLYLVCCMTCAPSHHLDVACCLSHISLSLSHTHTHTCTAGSVGENRQGKAHDRIRDDANVGA